MGYRENVQQACDRIGIANPIQEKDLIVDEIVFYCEGKKTTISATDMNRAGRLFFQLHVRRIMFTQHSFLEMEPLQKLQQAAVDFFAENWQDAEEKGRAMLVAFKRADGITIRWK